MWLVTSELGYCDSTTCCFQGSCAAPGRIDRKGFNCINGSAKIQYIVASQNMQNWGGKSHCKGRSISVKTGSRFWGRETENRTTSGDSVLARKIEF
jgi:hypothetical protein